MEFLSLGEGWERNTYLWEEGEGGGEDVRYGKLHQEVVHPSQLRRNVFSAVM